MRPLAVLILFVSCLVVPLVAQDHVEIGAFADYLNFSRTTPHINFVGVGGRLAGLRQKSWILSTTAAGVRAPRFCRRASSRACPKTVKGDRGGIIFRSDSAATKFYLLRFDQNGTYNFFVYSGNSGSNAKNLLEGSAPSFHTGANQANQIAVVARGSNIYLYVNQQYLTSLTDSTYSSGSIAVFAEDHTNSTEVAFSNAQVWKL